MRECKTRTSKCCGYWMNVRGNKVHSSARIHPDVVMGEGNIIHAGVVIREYRGSDAKIVIGNDNVIHEDVRIACEEFIMGDDCRLHNHVFIDGRRVFLSDNVWIGQYSHIDGYNQVIIQRDVTIGYNCYIWTHARREGIEGVPEIPGINYSVVLDSRAWLMGANIVVNPGASIGEGARVLSNSVVTRGEIECWRIYGGVPAKEIK